MRVKEEQIVSVKRFERTCLCYACRVEQSDVLVVAECNKRFGFHFHDEFKESLFARTPVRPVEVVILDPESVLIDRKLCILPSPVFKVLFIPRSVCLNVLTVFSIPVLVRLNSSKIFHRPP